MTRQELADAFMNNQPILFSDYKTATPTQSTYKQMTRADLFANQYKQQRVKLYDTIIGKPAEGIIIDIFSIPNTTDKFVVTILNKGFQFEVWVQTNA